MSNNLYLVFSRKPDTISMDQYHEWYTEHAQENIQSPGFVNAQRFIATEIEAGAATEKEEHLAVYQFAGDMSTWRTDLSRRIAAGDVVLPDWFKDIGFTSWSCSPVGDLLLPVR